MAQYEFQGDGQLVRTREPGCIAVYPADTRFNIVARNADLEEGHISFFTTRVAHQRRAVEEGRRHRTDIGGYPLPTTAIGGIALERSDFGALTQLEGHDLRLHAPIPEHELFLTDLTGRSRLLSTRLIVIRAGVVTPTGLIVEQ